MIELEMIDYLRGRPAIRNKIGAKAVFHARIPQSHKSALAVRVNRVASQRYYNLDGEDEMATVTIQVDIIGRRDAPIKLVHDAAEQVRMELSGYRGWWGDTYVNACTITRDNVITNTPVDASDNWPTMFQFDFRVSHQQAVPTLGD